MAEEVWSAYFKNPLESLSKPNSKKFSNSKMPENDNVRKLK